MQPLSRRSVIVLGLAALVAGCGGGRGDVSRARRAPSGLFPNETSDLRRLIDKYAREYDVPAPLIHRVIQRESSYR